MGALDGLAACAGTWRGTSTLQDPERILPDESASTATVTPVLDGRFVRVDYTWSYAGDAKEGSMLIGHERKEGVVTAHWIDGFHMSDKVMALRGPASSESATLSVTGSYPAPPGPDWGWRIEITPDSDAGSLRIVMFNIWPGDGREDLAVEAKYRRE
ncbi:MAG TPA: DUF1579 family protein [Longimicrobiaceae bacterium]|jgi:hypothetical protein|nr:DUF1579 family protein [Longimicrobiaceae bacterium]